MTYPHRLDYSLPEWSRLPRLFQLWLSYDKPPELVPLGEAFDLAYDICGFGGQIDYGKPPAVSFTPEHQRRIADALHSPPGVSIRKSRQAERWADFRRRAEFAPEKVYRHRARGWEYIPIHPFADEPELLARLGMQPEDCRSVDGWWGIDGDATLLESGVVGAGRGPAGRFVKATSHEQRWVYLLAVFDAPCVTRTMFEAAMERFAIDHFPHDALFQLRWGDSTVEVLDGSGWRFRLANGRLPRGFTPSDWAGQWRGPSTHGGEKGKH